MKKANIKTAMLLLVAAMTTAACSSNDAGDTASTVLPVSVTATVADMQTRATNITTDNLANFGLSVNPDVSATTWSSSQVTKASESWTLATPITWDTEKAASVAAYAPYQATSPITVPTSAGGAPTMVLSANTSKTSEPTDWLYNYQASVTPVANTPLSITFHHAMSRLRVTVGMNSELAGYSVTKVWVEGTLTNGTLTLSATPAVAASGAAADVFATNKDESATDIYSAFLVPQSVSAGTLKIHITVSKDGTPRSYTYSPAADATFGMGKAYGLSLTLGKYAVTLNGSGITGLTSWGDAANEPDL